MSVFRFMHQSRFKLLALEQEKSENLLLNSLPKEIAPILKNNPGTIAEHYDGASILFADIVNFTPWSVELPPKEMVEMLNEIFSYFDSLLDKYGVEKIRTIGDNYMAASGKVPPLSDSPAGFVLVMENQVSDKTRIRSTSNWTARRIRADRPETGRRDATAKPPPDGAGARHPPSPRTKSCDAAR